MNLGNIQLHKSEGGGGKSNRRQGFLELHQKSHITIRPIFQPLFLTQTLSL